MIDESFVEISLDKLLTPAFDLGQASSLGGSIILRLFRLPVPNGLDGLPEKCQVSAWESEIAQVVNELLLHELVADLDLAAPLSLAVVIAVVSTPPLGPCRRDKAVAAAAAHESSQWEVWTNLLVGQTRIVPGVELSLHPIEGSGAHKGRMVPHLVDAEAGNNDLADVEGIAEHLGESLWVEPALARGEASILQAAVDFLLGVDTPRKHLEGFLNQGGTVGIDLDLAVVPEVAHRYRKDPAPPSEVRGEPLAAPIRSHIVVELGEGRQDALRKLPNRGVVDGLGDRPQVDAATP